MRTQVVIIGAGPAGLILSQLLDRAGIDTIILERRSRAYVENRIRAGVLEPGTVDILMRARIGERLHREALTHDGFAISFGEISLRIDLKSLAGAPVTVYGQTEITQDLIAARLLENGKINFEATDVTPLDFDGTNPHVTYRCGGVSYDIACDFIAGCDGSHGVSRASVPDGAVALYEHSVPFGWLGVLSESSPVSDELIYAGHDRGFALCSMRSKSRSRYYVQCPVSDSLDAWSDARFWDELRRRIPSVAAERLVTGSVLEKSIAPLRSFVAEPMRFGKLFLAGDAAHIVPPTGAKGLNLAVADAADLAAAFVDHFRSGDSRALDTYSKSCLERAWRAVRFSWWFSNLTHRFADDAFTRKLQLTELDALGHSRAAATVLAENYLGKFAGV